MVNIDKIEIVKSVSEELLKMTGVDVVVEVSEDKANEAILIDLKSEESNGLLIGNHGETLNSLQTIIALIVQKKTGEWIRILVNVSDWRKKQEDRLSTLAFDAATRAKETGEDQPIYNLSSSDRRVIHMVLAEDGEVSTESVGEGKDRYLVVKSK